MVTFAHIKMDTYTYSPFSTPSLYYYCTHSYQFLGFLVINQSPFLGSRSVRLCFLFFNPFKPLMEGKLQNCKIS